jgi:hypothetical protein
MPFTLSHPAAAIPLARWGLPLSALVVGSMSPDFFFYLRLMPPPWGHFSHSVAGLFLFCLPSSLLVLCCFHMLLKWSIISLLPHALQMRLVLPAAQFTFLPWSRFAMVVVAVLIGAATHLIWDSFTHGSGWAVDMLPILLNPVLEVGPTILPLYKVLQYLSTVAGAALVGYWSFSWLRTAPLHQVEKGLQRSAEFRMKWTIVFLGGSLTVGLLNGWWQLAQEGGTRRFVVGGLVAAIAGLFVLLLVFSIVGYFSGRKAREFSSGNA